LPLLLIFGGVIGGLLAFGLVGIFLGPTILAVGYTLLGAWIDELEPGPSVRITTVGVDEVGYSPDKLQQTVQTTSPTPAKGQDESGTTGFPAAAV